MNKYFLAIIYVLIFLATKLSATTINIRQEYVPDSNASKSRLLMAHRFNNQIGVSFEIKYGNKNKAFEDMYASGHETKISYNWKLSDRFSLEPAILLDADPSKITYKYDLKGAAKIVGEWGASLRYRFATREYADIVDKTKDNIYHQLNLVTWYKFTYVKVGADFEYKFLESTIGQNVDGWKGNDNDHLVNFTAEWVRVGWVPFAEFAFITAKSTNALYRDIYQERLRLGVKYSF